MNEGIHWPGRNRGGGVNGRERERESRVDERDRERERYCANPYATTCATKFQLFTAFLFLLLFVCVDRYPSRFKESEEAKGKRDTVS